MPKFRFLRVLLSVSIAAALTPAAAFAVQNDEGSSDIPANEAAIQNEGGADGVEADLDPEPSAPGSDEPDGELGNQGNLVDDANDSQEPVGETGSLDDSELGEPGDGDEIEGDLDGIGDEADAKKDADAEGEDTEKRRSEPEDASKGGEKSVHVVYKAHVSTVGWQEETQDGETAGTTGRGLAVEALQIKLDGIDGGVSYCAHVAQIGWQDSVADGKTAGTTGKALAVEALKISLTSPAADSYDIYYRVHSSNLGWLGWARNGEPAGSAGQGLAVEAVEIVLVPKGSSFDGYGVQEAFSEQVLTYRAHVSNIGWMAAVGDGEIAGTSGRGLSMEAFEIRSSSTVASGDVLSQGYVEFAGWQDAVTNGVTGTTGQSRSLQAVKLSLTGELAERYDIYYRVHVSYVGWLDWACNGAEAGSLGFGQHIEAIVVKLIPKGAEAPGATDEPLQSNGEFHYQAHAQNYGWMTPVKSGETAGTTGKSSRLEALSISLGEIAGSVEYRAHVQNIGWQDWVADGGIAGTEGRSLAIEAVQIKLTGEAAENYDVYYRVHSAIVGWLGWAKNGDPAGTKGCSFQAEAIQIQLVKKGEAGPASSGDAYRELDYSFKANSESVGWSADLAGGSIAWTTGKSLSLYQLSTTTNTTGFTGEMQIAVHSADIGWQDYAGSGAVAGVEGKHIEAIKVRLTEDLEKYFDVWYRVHASNIGWMGWARNGAPAGTESLGYAAEAVQILVLPKGSAAPGSTIGAYRNWSYTRLAGILDSFSSGGLVVFGTNKRLSSYASLLIADAIRNYTSGGCDVGFVMIDLETGSGIAYNANQVYTSCCTIKAPVILSLNKYWPWTLNESEYDMTWSLWNSTNETYYNLINRYGHSTINTLASEVNAHVAWYGPGYFASYTAKDLAKMWLPSAEYLLYGNSYNAQWLADLLSRNEWITSRDAISADAVYAKSGWIDNVHNEGALVVKDGHPYVISIMSSSSPGQSWRMSALVQALDYAHSELTN